MTTNNHSNKTILVGAGLSGSLLSIYLAMRGYEVDIFERRPDMRNTEISAGRSINMALSTRGIFALQEVDVLDEIMRQAIPMCGRMVHAIDGELSFLPYGKDDSEVIYSISRGGLNMALMDAAEKKHGVTIQFNEKCTGMNLETGEAQFYNAVQKISKKINTGTIIGTDGSASAIRMAMFAMPRFNYSQQYIEHGYKELSIPPGPGGTFQIEKNALHIWPRGAYMLIALPNMDGSFTCTLFYPFAGENSFESLNTGDDVVRFFQQQFPDAVPLMPTLVDDFFANPTGSLVTVRCFPWHFGERVALLGDAAHAIVPFFGQGMNCCFEDCTYLNQCIEKYNGNWEHIFADYENLRKDNADAIADLALANFIEMRDHVADPKFALKKEIELALEKRFPALFIPKYSMVTFHRDIPYATALKRGKKQEQILDILCEPIDDVDELDWGKARDLIHNGLGNLPLQNKAT
ncbi:MAG: FAD-dependent oxidoreductase [bacterium]